MPTTETWLPTPVPSLGCSSGYFYDEAAGACAVCPEGTYNNDTQAPFNCEQCAPGEYQSGRGASECIKCPDGAIVSEDSTECTFCSAGYFSFNSTTCVACPLSTYAPAPRGEACIQCPSGFAPGVPLAATSCPSCEAGKYTSGYSCVDCPSGKYSGSGSSSCTSCEMGKYANESGSTDCFKCPGNLYSSASSTYCTLCRRNYYLDPDGDCQLCPTGTICDENGESNYLELELAKGYWRIADNSEDILKCPLRRSCRGGLADLGGNGSRWLGEFGDVYCSAGYTGILCSVCDTDNAYYKNFDSGMCDKCSESNPLRGAVSSSPTLLAFCILLLVVLLVVAATTVRDYYNRKKESSSLNNVAMTDASSIKLKPKTLRKRLQFGVEFKQFISFVQVIASMRYTCGVRFPAQFDGLLAVLSVFDFDVYAALGIPCQNKHYDFIDRMIYVTAAPIILCVIVALAHAAISNMKNDKHSFYYALWFISFFTLANSSTILVEFWQCREFFVPAPESSNYDDDKSTASYLLSDLSVDCNGERYAQYTVYAILMLFIYPIGLPLLYAFFIWDKKALLGDPIAMQRQVSRRYPKVGHIIFLFEGYSSRYYWYELADTLRRLCLTAGLTIISHMESVLSPTVGLLLSLVSVHVAEWRPFMRQGDNIVGITNQYVTTLLYLAAVLIKTNSSSQVYDDDIYGWALVGIFSVAPIVAICKIATEYLNQSRGAEIIDEWVYRVNQGSAPVVGNGDVETQDRLLEMATGSARSARNDLHEPESVSSPSSTRSRLAAERAARRAPQAVDNSVSRRSGAAEDGDEDAQRPQTSPQTESRTRKPTVRNVTSRPRGRQPKTSNDSASNLSEIELMASQPESPEPVASPASTSRVTKLRERKAALLKERDDRAKGRSEPMNASIGESSGTVSPPQPPVPNEDEAAETAEEALAKRKAKCKAKMEQRKAREAADPTSGEKSRAGNMLGSMPTSGAVPDSSPAEVPSAQTSPDSGDNEEAVAPQDANALRKAKYKAKLAQRKEREAAAAAAAGSPTPGSEKSEAGSMLNTTPASDAVAEDAPAAVAQPTSLVARMQRRKRNEAKGAHVDVQEEEPGEPFLQQQPSAKPKEELEEI